MRTFCIHFVVAPEIASVDTPAEPRSCDLLSWRLVLAILNGEIELEREGDLNGEQTQHSVWFQCCET